MKPRITWLSDYDLTFPDIEEALDEPNGLLAAGGDLSPDRLLAAYRRGIFPWFEDNQPILWWSPDPRCVIDPADYKPSRSLTRRLKRHEFAVSVDTAFAAVIEQCRIRPAGQGNGTWITSEMRDAYIELHELGYAHSIECYRDDELVGGLYGVSIGRLFFGESMFHRETDASKVAFTGLMALMAAEGCPLVDCQIPNSHLLSLGATRIPRRVFKDLLARFIDTPPIDWASLQGQPQMLTPWSA